jgi:hypothetical protein
VPAASVPSDKISPTSRVIIVLTFLVAVWFLIGVANEGTRMVNGTPMSPLHAYMYNHRIKVADQDCVRTVAPGTNPFLAPIGNCEYLTEDYAKSNAYSVFTRHGIIGKNSPWRVLVDCIHLFGALSIIVFLTILATTPGGMNGTAPLNKLAKGLFLSTVYTMWCTGFAMYMLQEDGDKGFFPRITPQDMPWLRNWLFLAFSVSFLTTVGHANLFKPVPLRLLLVQHVLSVIGWVPLLPVLFYRFFTLDTHGFEWMYTVELLSLVTLYPVLDIVNGWVLYQTQVKGRSYDWDAHRNDNMIIFIMMVVSTVLFMVGCDKHYFFAQTLPPVYRLAFTLFGTVVWVGGGWAVAWVRRAWNASSNPLVSKSGAAEGATSTQPAVG